MRSVILSTFMATQWFNALVVIGAGGVNVGLLFLNREILTSKYLTFSYAFTLPLFFKICKGID